MLSVPARYPFRKRRSQTNLGHGDEAGARPAKTQKVIGTSDLEERTASLNQVMMRTDDLITYTPASPTSTSPVAEVFLNHVNGITSERLAMNQASIATPSLSQSSSLSVTTQGGMTNCDDGGQDFERVFWKKNTEKIVYRNYKSSQCVLKSVRKDLNAAKVQVRGQTPSWFLPCTDLYGIMNQKTVGLLLQECFPDQDLGGKIMSFQKAFTILILINKQADLPWFIEKELYDSRLPFDYDEINHPKGDYMELLEGRDWENEDFRNFCRVRSEVSPVFFAVSTPFGERERTVHYQCRPGEILPFIKYHGTIGTMRGGFGEVVAYQLHEDQQNLHRRTKDGPSRAVAVKRLYRADGDTEFKQEYKMLDRLNHLPTPHLAKLLASYEIPNGPDSCEYFLIFECADTSLSKIWERDQLEWATALKVDKQEIGKWAAIQAHGLAEALMQLHDFKKHRNIDDIEDKTHGLHGDLKAENILHYSNWTGIDHKLGVLQITDFGLSSFHCTKSAEDIRLRGTNVYRPPEAAASMPLSYSFDIWSLGCLFIEFLIWLQSGPESLASFREARKRSPGFSASSVHACFWEVTEADECTVISLSHVVVDRAINLYNDPGSSHFVRDFTELIINQMLVVEEFRMSKKEEEHKNEGTRERHGTTKTRHSSSTKRIPTTDLAKALEEFTSQGPNYFMPSSPNRAHSLQQKGHRVIIPRPKYEVDKEVKARARNGSSYSIGPKGQERFVSVRYKS